MILSCSLTFSPVTPLLPSVQQYRPPSVPTLTAFLFVSPPPPVADSRDMDLSVSYLAGSCQCMAKTTTIL